MRLAFYRDYSLDRDLPRRNLNSGNLKLLLIETNGGCSLISHTQLKGFWTWAADTLHRRRTIEAQVRSAAHLCEDRTAPRVFHL
jgi:hypothetical protein